MTFTRTPNGLYLPDPPPPVGTHEFVEGGEECCAVHLDGPDGTCGPGCRRCKHCRDWVRPHRVGDPCEKNRGQAV